MRAQVGFDETVRTIQIKIVPGSVPDWDVTSYYHKKPRVFRPDQVTVKLNDDRVSSVTVSGGLVLKSGGASEQVRESVRYYRWSEKDRTEAPAWLVALIDEAPTGTASWQDEAL